MVIFGEASDSIPLMHNAARINMSATPAHAEDMRKRTEPPRSGHKEEATKRTPPGTQLRERTRCLCVGTRHSLCRVSPLSREVLGPGTFCFGGRPRHPPIQWVSQLRSGTLPLRSTCHPSGPRPPALIRGPPIHPSGPWPPAQIRVPPIQPGGAFPFSRRDPQTKLFSGKGKRKRRRQEQIRMKHTATTNHSESYS